MGDKINRTEKKPSIVDVANLAGVSIATVSRVFNKTTYPVSAELKKKVYSAIDKLEYAPDSFAHALKTGRSYTIAYLVSDISNSHFTVISKAIEDAISPLGYSLVVCSTNSNSVSERKAITRLMANHVDGIIINTSGGNNDFIADISRQVPTLLLHRKIYVDSFAGDFVGNDNFVACKALGEYIIEKGHRNIGILASDRSISTFKERTSGFFAAFRAHGITLPKSHVAVVPYTMDGGYNAVERLFRTDSSITIFASVNNMITMGAMKFFQTHKIAVPKEISIVSFGDIQNAALFYARPTFFSQMPELVGKKVAELILARIENPRKQSENVVVPSEFVEGNSVKNLMRRKK